MRALVRILPLLVVLLYIISPIDLVPDFLPGLGWIDDVLLLAIALWYLTMRRPGESPWDFYRRAKTWQGQRKAREAEKWAEDLRDYSQDDPYTLLGVERNASQEEIKAAYRRAVSRYHPDKVAHLGKEFQELAHKKLLAIQKAYEDLTKG